MGNDCAFHKNGSQLTTALTGLILFIPLQAICLGGNGFLPFCFVVLGVFMQDEMQIMGLIG